MIVNLNDIPQYFQESELYKSSIVHGNELEIDPQFTKFDGKFINIEELCHYLDTIQHWGFNNKDYPVELYSILDTWSFIQHLSLSSITIKIKYPDLNIIDEISFINNKRPMQTYKPKIVVKKGLSYLEANELIEEAAEKGYFGLVKYALKIDYILTDLVALKSAEKGHIEILQLCFNNISSMKYIENRMEKTKYNDTVFVKVIHNELQSSCYFNSICRYAAKNGHLECLMLARQFNCPWDSRVCSDAASRNQYECLKYAHENGCPWTKYVCYYASYDNLQCLIYAHTHGCPWDSNTCKNSAKNGHLECLKYAYENGCLINEIMFIKLASKNNFTALKFFNENYPDKLNISRFIIVNNYKWDESLTALIAFNGNLKALKIYRKYNCPWDKKTTYYAIKKGHYECLKYAIKNICPLDENILINLILS
jgi:hypothetical protein